MVKTRTVIAMFHGGFRAIEIATALKVGPEQIRRHLRRGGIAPQIGRPRSQPKGDRISLARTGLI